MITTLDTYFENTKNNQTETEYKYYNQPIEENSKKTWCQEKGYAHMPIKDIAKLIRKDLKTRYGKTIKFSVTSRGYPREINVTIKSISKQYIMTENEFKTKMENSYRYDESMYDEYMKPYTAKNNNDLIEFKEYHLYDEVRDEINGIIDKYNYDNSDLYTDYFDVNYYTGAGVDCDWRGVLLIE
ncbi:LPD29 domain-containing protein [Methanosphaera sp. ISO3-F5]|uniref:LPD29 domain-containing protein n=1 Tax=Methanosphaera sp. ISO3-F5 TaxID=1452353 RepID=UPI002B261477|nr:LPD29 domain-containing protein [Methanosphaera sp. ISO3-F5]WQH64070.1 hypothetical protein PXD04_10245 [Methanosphaera sp. ISO3-F5]